MPNSAKQYRARPRAKRTYRKPEYSKLYSLQLWRKGSRAHLAEQPLCVKCGKLATVVDHIKPHKGNMQRFVDQDNWQSLCKLCHDRKTGSGS